MASGKRAFVSLNGIKGKIILVHRRHIKKGFFTVLNLSHKIPQMIGDTMPMMDLTDVKKPTSLLDKPIIFKYEDTYIVPAVCTPMSNEINKKMIF